MESLKAVRLPAILLAVMFILMLGSSLGDSLTTDEQAHIPAGYSYVKHFDFRLNPEHPPIVKALAGIPLLFLNLNFPTNIPSWTTDINAQWAQGTIFIFESGNNVEWLIFWARLPMILLTLLLGVLAYWFAKKRFGQKVAALTLFLFAFSPTFIAHGHLVTTDIGASIGFLIGIWTFIRFLENPSGKNILIAGIALGIAELLKFSTFLLIPVYGVFLIVWAATQMQETWTARLKTFAALAGKTVLIGVIGVILILLVYAIFTQNYPALSYKPNGTPYSDRELQEINKLPDDQRWQAIRQIPLSQKRDTIFTLGSFASGPDYDGVTCDLKQNMPLSRRIRCLAEMNIRMIDTPWLRPLAEYLLGFNMVIQRSAGGNNSYFWGEVSSSGSRLYFPVVYLTKEPLPFLILSLIAIGLALQRIVNARPWSLKRLGYWLQNNFAIFAMLFFVAFYWLYSMRSPLNIGVRHVLPTFLFLYIAVSREVVLWLRGAINPSPASWREWLSSLYRTYIAPIPRYIIVSLLMLWLMIEVALTYPLFLSYYNQLIGGTRNGYKIAVDSNYDWGQDLKRLRQYLEKNQIEKINLNYFGGSVPQYYLGDRYEPWWSSRGPASGYFAISTTLLQGSTQPTAPGFIRNPADAYPWLAGQVPIARAGYSIFIYKLP